MSTYCIMRMQKLKSARSLVGALQHNTRDRMPPNADPDLSDENFNYGGKTLETMNRYHSLLPKNVRANAVHVIELIMTASLDYAGDWKQYLQSCDTWAQDLFGKKNLLHINHHYDETTAPHSHILIMPLKDGKLNAKHFIGGSKTRMEELQTDFYEKVGKIHGLDRGVSKAETKARHTPPTLAVKAAALDEREAKLARREKAIAAVSNHPPEEVAAAVSAFEELKTKTPVDLRNLAGRIQEKSCTTWGEYREKMQRESQKKQQQQEQKKTQGRSR